MTGKCQKCQKMFNVRVRRGDKISNSSCPDCAQVLQGITAGTSGGRYLCPIMGCVVTLGQTGVNLDKPNRLVFEPGTELPNSPNAYRRDEPNKYEQRSLDRVAGRVLGRGCVVSEQNDPHRFDDVPDAWRVAHLARAGLRLVEAVDPGDPADWLVNEPLTYRKCVVCGGRTPDIPDHRVLDQWIPRREYVIRGRGRYDRHWDSVNKGPHPAGSLACPDCDPRRGPQQSVLAEMEG